MKCNCDFKWFEGGPIERFVQFCFYAAAAVIVASVFHALGLL